jgi:hypothetical protein
MLRYYGQTLSGFAKLNSQVPNLHLPDLQEEQRYLFLFYFLPREKSDDDDDHDRLIDLEARRKRGKVTPKKGKLIILVLGTLIFLLRSLPRFRFRLRKESDDEEAIASFLLV